MRCSRANIARENVYPRSGELALRFETGRGAVREAFGSLETLGLTKSARERIGSRGSSIEANLDVLGPLLDLHPVPDAELVDQCLKVLELLVGDACDQLLAQGSETSIAAVRERISRFLALSAGDPNLLTARLALSRPCSVRQPARPIPANGLRMQRLERLWPRLPEPDEARLRGSQSLALGPRPGP